MDGRLDRWTDEGLHIIPVAFFLKKHENKEFILITVDMSTILLDELQTM